MPRKGNETSTEWLGRVINISTSPKARRLARFALDQWATLGVAWKLEEVKTRRSLWDLLSGILQIAKNTEHHCDMTPVEIKGRIFYFPIFTEACDYRGKKPPSGSVASGIRVQAHRRPQTAKWGNEVLKT